MRQILKQYGISEESPEENESSSRLDDLSCKEKHVAAVPSSVIHDSEMVFNISYEGEYKFPSSYEMLMNIDRTQLRSYLIYAGKRNMVRLLASQRMFQT